jgi:hypothetical protein
MDRFTTAIRQSLENKNWYAALYLSLTLPDICARLEADNGKTSGPKFVAWFDQYLADKYRHRIGGSPVPHVFLSGNDCYALRCSMLHEGGADITTQRCREVLERFHFTVVGAHCNQFNSILQLDVPTFCKDVCSAAERWYSDFKQNHTDKQVRLAELVTVHVGAHGMGNGIHFG